MATSTPWRASAGDTYDNEGFLIITDASSLKTHAGLEEPVTVWPESWPFASSVAARVDADGTITLFRDGKGDTMEFDLNLASSGTLAPVLLNGRHVAFIKVNSDGESGFWCATGSDTATVFARITEGLVSLGTGYMV